MRFIPNHTTMNYNNQNKNESRWKEWNDSWRNHHCTTNNHENDDDDDNNDDDKLQPLQSSSSSHKEEEEEEEEASLVKQHQQQQRLERMDATITTTTTTTAYQELPTLRVANTTSTNHNATDTNNTTTTTTTFTGSHHFRRSNHGTTTNGTIGWWRRWWFTHPHRYRGRNRTHQTSPTTMQQPTAPTTGSTTHNDNIMTTTTTIPSLSIHPRPTNPFSPTNLSSRRRRNSNYHHSILPSKSYHHNSNSSTTGSTTHRPSSSSSTSTSSATSLLLYATIHDVPHLVQQLQSSLTITCDQANHTLRRLFALSEYTSQTMRQGTTTTTTNTTTTTTNTKFESLEETRKQMIMVDTSSLVPALFHFLFRCYTEPKKKKEEDHNDDDDDSSKPKQHSTITTTANNNNITRLIRDYHPSQHTTTSSSLQHHRRMVHPASVYLALLVLNNLCIPHDNKRYIAFQCHGIDILCHWLCYDPSCRMLAIVLVNLTFGTNVQFQQDLLFRSHNNNNTTTMYGTPKKTKWKVDTELLSSLAYVLRVASLTREEYNIRQRLFDKEAHEIFRWDSRYNTLMVHSSTTTATITITTQNQHPQQLPALLIFDQPNDIYMKSWPISAKQLYPDTARWCICALHHLTRPLMQYHRYHPNLTATTTSATVEQQQQQQSSAAMALTRTNIVPHLLCCIRIIGTNQDASTSHPTTATNRIRNNLPNQFRLSNALLNHCHSPSSSSSPSFQYNRSNAATADVVPFNDPSTWVKETSQDAALFVIMNISIDPWGRKYLLGHDIDTVYLLAMIADSYHPQPPTNNSDMSLLPAVIVKTTSSLVNSNELSDAMKVQQFQCVKARMTLSYLLGSQGHYGQEKCRVGKWVQDYIQKGQVLTMKYSYEVEQLIDMLAHTLYRRTKVGPGGYSGTTFRLKYVVWSIRCLLSQPNNQEMFAGNGMEVVNALLIKILALRAIRNVSYIDSETVEYACFSLYLLSHYGFHICFLPTSLGKEYNVRHIVTKVLIAIQSMDDTTLATHHAIRQILYRLRYLLCIDTTASIASTTRYTKWRYQRYHNNRIIDDDNYILEQNLVLSIRNTLTSDKVRSGAQPRPDIFNRPIIAARHRRSHRSTTHHNNSDDKEEDGPSSMTAAPDHSISRTYYNSAIHAAYDFSFQSTNVRHLNETTIDDIMIANNIANCADGTASIESYGYTWTWDDDDDDREGGATTAMDDDEKDPDASKKKNSLWSIFSSHQNCCIGITTIDANNNNITDDALSLSS